MKLLVATRNRGKEREIRDLLAGAAIDIASLADHPEIPDVIEDGKTFLENARKKAQAIRLPGFFVLADDSGLVVDALGGAPGVLSARYAGKHRDQPRHTAKLLKALEGVPSEKRQAAFICAVVLIAPDGRCWEIEERAHGFIALEPRGEGGFGYDPVFFVPEKGKTFAKLSAVEKNAVSHRGKAMRKVREILVEILGREK